MDFEEESTNSVSLDPGQVSIVLAGDADGRALADVLDFTFLAEQIAEIAFTDPGTSLTMLREIPNGFPFLRYALVTHIGLCIKDITAAPRETDIRKIFYDNLCSYIHGAKKITRKMNKSDRPDGFISLCNKELPVEIKRYVFTNASLSQLKRYMRMYDCNRGVAVAKRFECDIDDNVIYITI